MTPAWPVLTVPVHPRRNTFQETAQSNRIAFQAQAGAPPKMRRRFTSSIWRASWRRHLTQVQLEAFWIFYKDTLANGTLKFTLDHPIYGTNHTWRFAPDVEPGVSEQNALYIVNIDLLRLD